MFCALSQNSTFLKINICIHLRVNCSRNSKYKLKFKYNWALSYGSNTQTVKMLFGSVTPEPLAYLYFDAIFGFFGFFGQFTIGPYKRHFFSKKDAGNFKIEHKTCKFKGLIQQYIHKQIIKHSHITMSSVL